MMKKGYFERMAYAMERQAELLERIATVLEMVAGDDGRLVVQVEDSVTVDGGLDVNTWEQNP